MVLARPESARADPSRAKIPEGGRFAAAALLFHIKPLGSQPRDEEPSRAVDVRQRLQELGPTRMAELRPLLGE